MYSIVRCLLDGGVYRVHEKEALTISEERKKQILALYITG